MDNDSILNQTLGNNPSVDSSQILCSYVNVTRAIQIIRIVNIPNLYFERSVFPGQKLLFKSLREAQLEIHTGAMISSILSDRVPCQVLQVNE
jgi:hypothetical protein